MIVFVGFGLFVWVFFSILFLCSNRTFVKHRAREYTTLSFSIPHTELFTEEEF